MVLYKAGVIKKDEKKNRWYFVPEAQQYKEWEDRLRAAHDRDKAANIPKVEHPAKAEPSPEPKKEPEKALAPPQKEESKPPESKADDAKIDMEQNWSLSGLWTVNGLDSIQRLEKLKLGRWVGSDYVLDKNTAERLAKDPSMANARKIADERQKLVENKQSKLSEEKKAKFEQARSENKPVLLSRRTKDLESEDGLLIIDEYALPDGTTRKDEYYSNGGMKQKSDDDLANLTHEEYLSVITPQPFLKSSRNFIVQALLKIQQYTDFANLAPQEAEGVYHSIIDVMTQDGGWSLSQITRKLQAKFPQLGEWEAERIARTETTAIANKARELDFQDSQPPETLYYWGGPDDDRTSDVCREIKERLKGQGLPLGALKALVNEVSVKYGMKPRDWTPHPQCRHTVRIWYGDL
jgi:hypothetical protein